MLAGEESFWRAKAGHSRSDEPFQEEQGKHSLLDNLRSFSGGESRTLLSVEKHSEEDQRNHSLPFHT